MVDPSDDDTTRTELLAGRDYPRTYREFVGMCAHEEACRTYLEHLRWPAAFACPACGASGVPWRQLRLLRGEDLESVSRELGVTAARASQWRDQFLVAGQAGLKSRATEAVDDASRRLQATVGELLMENELLYAKVDHLEAGVPLARRRSTR